MNIKDLYSLSEEEISEIVREGNKLLYKGPIISFPTDILPKIDFRKSKQEHFAVASLDGSHQLISLDTITIGTLNRTLIHPREVFAKAIEHRAASILLIHNHPSGNLEPSSQDIEITNRLVTVGEVIGIKVLDHMIVSSTDYYSFVEDSKLPDAIKDENSFMYTVKRTKNTQGSARYHYSVRVYAIIANLISYKFTFNYTGSLKLDVESKVRDSLRAGDGNPYTGYSKVYLTEIRS